MRHEAGREGSRQMRKDEREDPGKLLIGAWAGGCLVAFWEESNAMVQGNS